MKERCECHDCTQARYKSSMQYQMEFAGAKTQAAWVDRDVPEISKRLREMARGMRNDPVTELNGKPSE